MSVESLSLESARELAIRSQLLDGVAELSAGKRGVEQAIDRLGYVQIDTISVIERAHDHTLWTRVPGYRQRELQQLLAVDRKVFEYFAHGASYLPIEDYRFYLPRMRRNRESPRPGTRDWVQSNRKVLNDVIDRIRSEGPLASSDFEAPKGHKSSGWWNWKPAKEALEVLHARGELMIVERRNFQRVYDLTERVLSAEIDTRMPTAEEHGRFLVRRALSAHAIATPQEISSHIRWTRLATVRKALTQLQETGEVIQIDSTGWSDEPNYAWTASLKDAGQTEPDPRLELLSPFDNLVIDRDRIRRLFGFDYRLECYTPAAKRKFGYFVLPVLWGSRLVARLDPKADRQRELLQIRNLVVETGFRLSLEFKHALAQRLIELAEWNGCDQLEFQRTEPGSLARQLTAIVRKLQGK